MSVEPATTIIGRVIKPHGIRGEVVVDSMSDVPGRFDVGNTVSVGSTKRRIIGSRPHAGRLLVAFEGVVDRNGAELLRGLQVTANKVDLGDSDVLYVHELIGMEVISDDGVKLGEVIEVIDLPAAAGYDLLEVQRDGQRWLLPADDQLVEVATDPDSGRDILVVVDPPAGLLPGDDRGLPVGEPGHDRDGEAAGPHHDKPGE